LQAQQQGLIKQQPNKYASSTASLGVHAPTAVKVATAIRACGHGFSGDPGMSAQPSIEELKDGASGGQGLHRASTAASRRIA
jgi:hypothetical protein